MRHQITTERSVACRARRIIALLSPAIVLCAGVPLSPGAAYAGTQQNTGPILAGDDFNSASVNPYPLIQVSTIGSLPPGQCAWINAGMTAFATANPANGTGPSGEGWTYSWAGVADEAKIEAGISVIDYYPWVVNQPTVYTANGSVFAGAANFGEVGGAVFNISYVPQPGAPVLNNMHWIQAYTGTIRGAAFGPILDNGGYGPPVNPGDPPATPGGAAVAYSTQNSFSPYYDYTGAAGLWGNGAWFADRPFVRELEYENNPVVSSQFQVVLADVVRTQAPSGVWQNAVTLYGGEWWGFNYTATDIVPEPSTYVLLTIGGIGLLFFRRMAAKKRVA